MRLNKYANYMVDDMLAAQQERVPVVEAMITHAIASGELLHPMAASSLLRQLQRTWPETMWNVLIEENSGAHIYVPLSGVPSGANLQAARPPSAPPSPRCASGI